MVLKLRIVFALLVGLMINIPTFATTVKLKITYNGAGVANSDITIKNGDVALGSGRTDGGGNVSISVSSVISRQIDVYGSKVCGNAKKTWDVKGFASLNDDNFCHLKMGGCHEADVRDGYVRRDVGICLGIVCLGMQRFAFFFFKIS